MRTKFPNQIKICVLADHIKEGKSCDCQNCPIALAVNNYFKNDVIHKIRVLYTYAHIYIKIGNRIICQSYKMSRVATRFIVKFDNNQPVQPFNFIMKKTIF